MAIDLSGNNLRGAGDGPSSELFSSPGAFAITPSNSVRYRPPIRSIYVGSDAGAVSVVGADGNTVVFTAVPVGTILPIQAIGVNATGTTATNLVGIK